MRGAGRVWAEGGTGVTRGGGRGVVLGIRVVRGVLGEGRGGGGGGGGRSSASRPVAAVSPAASQRAISPSSPSDSHVPITLLMYNVCRILLHYACAVWRTLHHCNGVRVALGDVSCDVTTSPSSGTWCHVTVG